MVPSCLFCSLLPMPVLTVLHSDSNLADRSILSKHGFKMVVLLLECKPLLSLFPIMGWPLRHRDSAVDIKWLLHEACRQLPSR